VRWRQTETQLAWDAVKRHEIVGHGLGVFHRPRLVNDIFSGNDGRLYVHNYYLWLLVKGGWIYALATGGLLVLAAHRLVFWTVDDVGERLLRLVLACGLVGVLAAAVVGPLAGASWSCRNCRSCRCVRVDARVARAASDRRRTGR
jgi:O-antigen ligase